MEQAPPPKTSITSDVGALEFSLLERSNPNHYFLQEIYLDVQHASKDQDLQLVFASKVDLN